MNTNRVISLIVFAALLVGALFVIQSANASANPTLGRAARADQADIQRWVTRGEYFSKQLATVNATLIRDTDAARWQALGEAYLGINPRARQADAARWQALGEAYLGINSQARLADASRWQAMGEYYSTK